MRSPDGGSGGWVATEAQGKGLSQFLTKGVTKGTRNGYSADWRAWIAHVMKMAEASAEGDVYLDKVKSDKERAMMLALFFKERYETGGMRGRKATSVSAGNRHFFAAALRPVNWFDSQIVANARAVTRTPVRAVRVQAYVRTGSRTIRSIRFIAMIPAVFTCKLTTLFP